MTIKQVSLQKVKFRRKCDTPFFLKHTTDKGFTHQIVCFHNISKPHFRPQKRQMPLYFFIHKLGHSVAQLLNMLRQLLISIRQLAESFQELFFFVQELLKSAGNLAGHF